MRALVTVLLVAILFAGCQDGERRVVETVAEQTLVGEFYDTPDPLPAGEPGTLIKHERMLGAPIGAIAWRVLYHSTDVNGNDVPVSGLVIAPTGAGPAGGRPVVAWGHPTTGSDRHCAPSAALDPWLLIEGLHSLLEAGYVVTATDYPGMGAHGDPSFLIGASEGNAVLDSVRAAGAIDGAHANNKLLLWGHSQGGHAALFAAQNARTYAPDLDLVGVAVAAPAAELGELLDADIGDVSGITIGAYAFDTYQRVYDGPALTTVLTEAGAAATPEMAKLCLFRDNSHLHRIARPLIGDYVANEPTTTEPWQDWLSENTPGAVAIDVPIFVVQGETDTLVVPSTTDTYVEKLCASGEHVYYDKIPKTGHGLVALKSIHKVKAWYADLLAGKPVANNCAG